MMHSRSATSSKHCHTSSTKGPNDSTRTTTTTAATPSASSFVSSPRLFASRYFVITTATTATTEGKNDQEREQLLYRTSNAFQVYCFVLAGLFLFTDTVMTKVIM
eukprot:scaffold6387_cov88-Cylindrotheca_fusiformis.AAC.3